MATTTKQKRILVAPLNWGLGHAARCIPVIKALIDYNFEPVLASDGAALHLLKLEFAQLTALELPSYKISYPENGSDFKMAMLLQAPNIAKAIRMEKKTVAKLIAEHEIDGIISDNRPGVYSKKVPSIFMTHQVNVLSGSTSWISSAMQRLIIRKFDTCWIPDAKGKINLSGKLGHPKKLPAKTEYVGNLSRLQPISTDQKYDLLILLSGPEPQRSMLQKLLENQIGEFNGQVLFVKGLVEENQLVEKTKNVTYYNFMDSQQLSRAISESKLVLCRSGYSTIMDLSQMQKKAFFIPTPGQFEQEYLAKRCKKKGFAPYSKQERFTIAKLAKAELYPGLPILEEETDWPHLFRHFKGE